MNKNTLEPEQQATGLEHHPQRLIRPKDTAYMLGISVDKLGELRKQPDFPKPVKLCNSTSRNAPIAFLLQDLVRWIQKRAELSGVSCNE